MKNFAGVSTVNAWIKSNDFKLGKILNEVPFGELKLSNNILVNRSGDSIKFYYNDKVFLSFLKSESDDWNCLLVEDWRIVGSFLDVRLLELFREVELKSINSDGASSTIGFFIKLNKLKNKLKNFNE